MITKLNQWLTKVETEYGLSKTSQIKALLYARLALGLGISEYFELELFDRNKYPTLSNCIGRKLSAKIDKVLNKDIWRATANDKVLNYALLTHFNFPIPITSATYRSQQAKIDQELMLTTAEELDSFFSKQANFPLFIKPIHGSYGRGTFSLASYNSEQKSFQCTLGNTITLNEILAVGNNPSYKGLLIQQCLVPHPKMLATVGKNTSCVRVILIRDGEQAFIHRAFWKIARSHNITDNFSYGKHGNLLADVDIDSGKIKRVITGLWPEESPMTIHPDTGKELAGLQLPDWQKAIDYCQQACHIFPGLAMQSWDIAFCENGPVLMELNTEPNLEVPQLLSEHAFIDDRLLKVLKKHGW